MTKVSKDLEKEKNMVRQAKSSIKEIDKRIIEAQNPSAYFHDVAYIIFAIAARSATAI